MSNPVIAFNDERRKYCKQVRSATAILLLECRWTGFLLSLVDGANKILQNSTVILRMESDDPQDNLQQQEFGPHVETLLELITIKFLRTVVRFGNALLLQSFQYRLEKEPKEPC